MLRALAIQVILLLPLGAQAQAHRQARSQMGTLVEIIVWHDDAAAANAGIDAAFAEIERLEGLLSEWKRNSQISRVNDRAFAGPVAVGADVFAVLEHGLAVGRQSGGAFDVTWAALRGVWNFDAEPAALPDPAKVRAAAARIDYRQVTLDRTRRTVRFGRAGMAIGLGAIAKGYAVDRAAQTLKARGLANVLVTGGGDVMAFGSKSGAPWRVGIQHPRDRRGALLAVSALHDESLVTSGDYERFITVGGVRYHHIMDPKTGMPARGAMSASVVAKSAMAADALSTAAFVLGPTKGLALLEGLAGVEGVIVDAAGRIQMTTGAAKRVTLHVKRVVP